MNLPRILACLALALTCLSATARDVYVPPELEPWRDWVLHESGQIACPLDGEARACIWPGVLSLDVDADGGRFEQRVEVFDKRWYLLPGGAANWPQQVNVDGRSAAVTEQRGRAALWLEAGAHTISGRFAWTRLPEKLALANGTALIELTVSGERVLRPRWDRNAVWIARGSAEAATQTRNQLSATVYRLIQDGTPPHMEVHLQINVAGESREETIGRLVPEGFAPASMSSPLPARLDDEGNLKIQARPGSWTFRFRARTRGPLQALTFAPSGENWPREEVWSYAADPQLRVTEPRAANPVDPVQAGVPGEWQYAPAFRMTPGDGIEIAERQRGPSPGEANRLSLTRELWRDFDRTGYTARDQISGQMLRDWRLDMPTPFELKSAQLNNPVGTQDDLLITSHPDDPDKFGVEIRTPQVSLRTLSRLDDNATRLPVGGWDARFDRVQTTLYLPPGHRLLNAVGADRDPGSWVSRWNLLDFFLVLVVTVALWRMVAPWVGLVALAALTLSLHEPGAPQWAWFNLVIALALARYLPDGRVRQMAHSYKIVSALVVAVMLLPFAASQLRAALYPQLEPGAQRYAMFTRTMPMEPAAPVPTAEEMQMDMAQGAAEARKRAVARSRQAELEEITVTASPRNILNRYDSKARVQTGPGVPSWSWHRYALGWSGPVEADQETRLWIATPWMMRLWRVLMIGLLVALLALLLRRGLETVRRPAATATASLVLVALGLAGTLPAPPAAAADTPSPQILQELKTRLLTPPKCVPNCVDLARASVRFDGESLSIDFIAHAREHGTLDVPGQSGSWLPESVSIDGRPSTAMRRKANNLFHLRLDPGVHRISLRGRLPNANSVVVAFPKPPRHIEVSGDGWEVTGETDNRLAGGALTLIRRQDDREQSALDAIDVEQFPAFVAIHRQLVFDLDWTVFTTVRRQTPPTAAINLTVPLVPGESVTQEEVEVRNGQVRVSLPTGAREFTWTSTLDRVPQIALTAADDAPWQEHWILTAGPSWRLQHEGVPELNRDRSNEPAWIARFTPWPGETLRLSLGRPEAIEGPTMAIDNAQLRQSVGARSSEATLNLSYRATRGGQHAIALPSSSELTAVSIDGRPHNLALDGGSLRLPVTPGKHNVQIEWREPGGEQTHTRSAAVDLGIAASNLNLTLNLPASRWVLWTHGPRLGPAVLYWSELLVLVVVAIGLARFGRTPLKFHHWLLLGLGFSTFFWPAFAIVAGAFLALAWRERHTLDARWNFNLMQIVLVVLAFAAAVSLITTIPLGLLGTPDMHIDGHGSSARVLNWFVDQTDGPFPQGGALSLPMWIYKGLILIWALWIAFALLRWLPWMWRAFSSGGYWKSREKAALEDAAGE